MEHSDRDRHAGCRTDRHTDGRTDRLCTGTGTGIIIKSNLVSFKCDLYAESVCPFFPKTKDNETRKPRSEQKKKRNENWKSNPIPSNSVQSRRRSALAEWEGDEGGGGEQKEKQFLKSPENKKVFFDWNQFKLFSRKAAGICPNKTKGFNGVERIWSRLQSECIHQIHLRVPTTGTTPGEDQPVRGEPRQI